ncbi:hypothetical protein HX021_09815 [Sphingobacterium sp. N143]|uniref:hypothetical protein n=1 Tax=Sphingobacterium sp. N143 TaxID=2746727 RepID=UPI002575E0BF|nr:hypothetical protein [Sphingobacterium sp. N143]MDM1294587.1 hypothetical protein [Sphingobacterium sp. N143]
MLDIFKHSPFFPPENNKSKIWLDGDQLFYRDNGQQEQVSLTKLRYAYIELLGGEPFLFLFEDHQHYISAKSKGFSKVYPILSQQFGFHDSIFFNTIGQQEDCKAKIWIRLEDCNYKILPESYADDDEGFEVYTEPSQFISWDITYAAIERLGIGHYYTTAYGTRYFKIDYPVRVGSLWLKQLEIYCDNIPQHLAVQEYFSTLYDSSNTDKSYQDLRSLWLDDDAYDPEDYGYEREDQCYLSFDFGKQISSSICYTYDDETSYDDGGTSLHFYNHRDYSSLLEDPVYEKTIEVSDILKLKRKLDIQQNYRHNAAVKHIPAAVNIQLGKSSGFWLDKKNNKIGFAGKETSVTYVMDDIDYFEIQNILPAKGHGYALLLVYLKTGKYDYLYEADTYELDPYAQQLETWSGKKVAIPEAYYNC